VVDIFVSTTFANIAVELVANGQRGRMMAIRDGRYAHSPLPSQDDTAVSVDIDKLYDVERLRPRYSGLLGRPLMLGHSVDVLTNPYA
jgi:6-phosphofructokinase 1